MGADLNAFPARKRRGVMKRSWSGVFFFFRCALEKKMFWVSIGFGARARRRFPRGFGVVERGWGWWAATPAAPEPRNRCAGPDVSQSVRSSMSQKAEILPSALRRSRAGTWALDVSATAPCACAAVRSARRSRAAGGNRGACCASLLRLRAGRLVRCRVLRGWRGLLGAAV